MVFSRI